MLPLLRATRPEIVPAGPAISGSFTSCFRVFHLHACSWYVRTSMPTLFIDWSSRARWSYGIQKQCHLEHLVGEILS